MAREDEGTLCALTEQGDLGLGVHKGSDEAEREALRRRLEEIERSNDQRPQQPNRR